MLMLTIKADCQLVHVRNSEFHSVYNLETQCPQQVMWTVKSSDIGDCRRFPSWTFVQDVSDPAATARHSDFTRSGYDRGHMCPALDRSHDLFAMRSTFVMSNVAPQACSLNRGAWKQSETFCRLAAQLYDSVQIIALPIFLDRDTSFIGCHRLAVPHAFIKVAWLPRNDSIIGQWFYFNK